jgi:hypothetical protein
MQNVPSLVFLLQYLQTSISGAGSDGNFDSYLQDVPKVGSDILNMVILGSFAASSAIVLTIYMYIKLHLRRKFHKVRGNSSTFLRCVQFLWKYSHDCTNISVKKSSVGDPDPHVFLGLPDH